MKPFNFNKYIKNNPLLKELSPDTFKSAINKSKERGTDRRTERFGRLFFNEFIGKPLLGGTIKDIYTSSPQQGNYADVVIQVEKPAKENPEKMDEVFIYYDIQKDDYGLENKQIPVSDARQLSLIAKKINPDTKYKNHTATFNIQGN